jgi:hypothetical protein
VVTLSEMREIVRKFRAEKGRKVFFFEKKNQKTFSPGSVPVAGFEAEGEKFFASFFQKRSAFLLTRHQNR